MNSQLRFHRLVADDVRKAVRWYTDISDELGESFRDLLDAAFDDIERRPSNFSFAFDDVRFAKMKRFPYLVLFVLLDDEPFVLGVFHGSSNPDKWRRRAKS
jgi:hypothetical protein